MAPGRFILVTLALLGVLVSLSGAGAAGACMGDDHSVGAAIASAAMDSDHACCHAAAHSEPSSGQSDSPKGKDCCGPCFMQCCRAMVPAQRGAEPVDSAPVVASAVAPVAVVLSLTDPDRIFHPPKS